MEGSLVDVDLNDNSDYREVIGSVEEGEVEMNAADYGFSDPHLCAKTRAFIEQLLRRGHFGPFEHPQITFAIEGVSRSCMAQITRHRHATFDVQSMRYVNFDDAEMVAPESFKKAIVDDTDPEEITNHIMEEKIRFYNDLVEGGVPEEDARMILPIGTKVNMTATFNLRSLMHVIDMRHAGDSQWEARDLAKQMFEQAKEVAPITFEEYEEHAKGSSKKAP